jgi:hypothetical protein
MLFLYHIVALEFDHSFDTSLKFDVLERFSPSVEIIFNLHLLIVFNLQRISAKLTFLTIMPWAKSNKILQTITDKIYNGYLNLALLTLMVFLSIWLLDV